MNRIAPLLLLALLLGASVSAETRSRELDAGSPLVASARGYIERCLGPGRPFQTLEFVRGRAEHFVIPPNRTLSRVPWQSRAYCTFRFQPEGQDAIPVTFEVRREDGGPWAGGLPECGFHPRLYEVVVGRTAAIRIAEAADLWPDRDGWHPALTFRPQDGPGLYWVLRDASDGNGFRSNRLIVVDAFSGEWYEATRIERCLR